MKMMYLYLEQCRIYNLRLFFLLIKKPTLIQHLHLIIILFIKGFADLILEPIRHGFSSLSFPVVLLVYVIMGCHVTKERGGKWIIVNCKN